MARSTRIINGNQFWYERASNGGSNHYICKKCGAMYSKASVAAIHKCRYQ